MKKSLLVAAGLILILAAQASAFDGQRKGFVLGGGLGFGPVAHTEADGGGELDRSGVAINFIIGYAWNEKNMIVYFRDGVIFSEETVSGDNVPIAQGFGGLAWFHYFGSKGRSAFLAVGIGLQDFTSLDPDYESNDFGAGFAVSGGYEFTPHVQLFGTVSTGKTSIGSFDFTHNQVTVGISAVAF